MRVADFNLRRTHKPHGCRICEHNPMGVCELTAKEVPLWTCNQNLAPKWCPKGEKK